MPKVDGTVQRLGLVCACPQRHWLSTAELKGLINEEFMRQRISDNVHLDIAKRWHSLRLQTLSKYAPLTTHTTKLLAQFVLYGSAVLSLHLILKPASRG